MNKKIAFRPRALVQNVFYFLLCVFVQGRDGMKMNGTNGSQLWDAAFMVQGLIESGLKEEFKVFT